MRERERERERESERERNGEREMEGERENVIIFYWLDVHKILVSKKKRVGERKEERD